MIDNQQPPQHPVAEVRPAPIPKLVGGATNAIGMVINSTYPLSAVNGGTGVSNSYNITIGGGNFSTAGGIVTLNADGSGTSNVTLPPSGTLISSTVTSLPDLATVGTITSGTWNAGTIASSVGGTGVNNSHNITIGGGAFSTAGGVVTLNADGSGTSNVTLPPSGTLISSTVTSLPDLATVGTITSGTWNAGIIASSVGGTGVDNSYNITLGAGTFSTAVGAITLNADASGTSNVTLPASGTLATIGGNGVAVTDVTAAVGMKDDSAINIYVANTSGTVTALTTPSVGSVTIGHVFKVVGGGSATGWNVALQSGQTINLQASGTTAVASVSIASAAFSDCVDLVVTEATSSTTTFTVAGMYGYAPTFA